MQEIKFSIDPTLSIFENGFDETDIAQVQEQTKERLGYFQSWGYRIIRNENSELQESVGIVVDAETGKVFLISPEYITFPKNNLQVFDQNV